MLRIRRRFSAASSVPARYVAAIPRASSAATWSCISAISGETTSVVPGSRQAGSW
jgi:hypothetical protein